MKDMIPTIVIVKRLNVLTKEEVKANAKLPGLYNIVVTNHGTHVCETSFFRSYSLLDNVCLNDPETVLAGLVKNNKMTCCKNPISKDVAETLSRAANAAADNDCFCGSNFKFAPVAINL